MVLGFELFAVVVYLVVDAVVVVDVQVRFDRLSCLWVLVADSRTGFSVVCTSELSGMVE